MSVPTSEPIKKLIVGDIAPLFIAPLQSGENLDLQYILDSGKKVLLVFYPGDDTPGCTSQLCGIRDVYSEYKNLNVRVLGVNHADAGSHQKFIDKYNYPFDIIVDVNKKIINDYGAVKTFFKNLTVKRGIFLIDTDGKIIYQVWGQQNNQEIINFLKNNQ